MRSIDFKSGNYVILRGSRDIYQVDFCQKSQFRTKVELFNLGNPGIKRAAGSDELTLLWLQPGDCIGIGFDLYIVDGVERGGAAQGGFEILCNHTGKKGEKKRSKIPYSRLLEKGVLYHSHIPKLDNFS